MSSPATPAKVADQLRSTTARIRDEMNDRGPRGAEVQTDIAEFWTSASRVIRFSFHKFPDHTIEARIRGFVGERGHMLAMSNVGINLKLTSMLDFAEAFSKLLDRLETDPHGRVVLKPAAPASTAGDAAPRAPATAGPSPHEGSNGSNGATAPAVMAAAEGGPPRC